MAGGKRRPTIRQALQQLRDAVANLEDHEGINRKAVVILLHSKTGMPKRVIARVLNGVDEALVEYCDEGEVT